MLKIGLISDNCNFPSLPLMKLSAYHKLKGDCVKIVDFALEHFDILYYSKVFNLNLDKIPKNLYIPSAEKYINGGSGFAIEIMNGREVYSKEKDIFFNPEIENIYPDYSLYPEFTDNTAYGFLTRGCPNNCDFCIVSKKEGLCSKKVSNLKNFYKGQKNINLLDANILACKDREDLLNQLVLTNANITFSQGLDARMIDNDITKLLCRLKLSMVYFAFDLMKNEEKIIKGLKIFAKHFPKDHHSKRVYILTNFNTTPQEDYYRVKLVSSLGYAPYVTIYRKDKRSRFLLDLARWANNMALYNSSSFEDYAPRKDGLKMSQLYKDILRGI